ncbi:Ribosomal protein S18 acetylase RimI [Desulfopila aestuarii DSM 18488]|uniref:Ribosomal protein S18 acetylase RimI n=2 Tax=Desulfopila aestuarii TaxID=231440 RepID=A0A1M7Y9J6_9BACT|nr:Ribosomal protein S18 acetylase RimI [Desulfopila aestuarii DSM 18488]
MESTDLRYRPVAVRNPLIAGQIFSHHLLYKRHVTCYPIHFNKYNINMKIRTFQTDDTAAVIQLWQACGLTTATNDPLRDIERKLLVDADLFLVGEKDGRIVATVMGGYEGHRGWLNYLAVAPELRRQGYGQAIVHAIEQMLTAKGAPKINLQVRTSNQTVIEFYQTLGYHIDNVVSLGKRLVQDNKGESDG